MAPRHAAVVGRPIGHSLSPVLHRAAYRALDLDWSYAAIDCGVADLRGVLDGRDDWAGLSCTMPLKHVALAVADEACDAAATAGAANTLLPRPSGGWAAENTDVLGFADTFVEAAVDPGTAASVLGAGGTAQAAVVALARVGVGAVTVLVREPARAAAVMATAERAGIELTLARLDPAASGLGADLVISTLPPGAADGLAGSAWRPGQAVFDVVYSPWPTRLAGAAGDAGATVLSGARLLLHQAAGQVHLMTGRAAPLAQMRAALLGAAPGCGA